MRSPFRRRRRLPGASSEWNESTHVDLGPDHVAIPVEQLAETAEGHASFTGEKLSEASGITNVVVFGRVGDLEGPLVGIRMDLVAAEVARVSDESTSDVEIDELMDQAARDPANWMASADEEIPDDAQIIFADYDESTGQVVL